MYNTLKTLKEKGYQIKIEHYRYCRNDVLNLKPKRLKVSPYKSFRDGNDIWSRGGETHLTLITPTGTEIKGIGYCHLSDNYNRKIGALKALKNAFDTLHKLQEPEIL